MRTILAGIDNLTNFYPPADRVKWFRDKSARDRAQEEKEILEEEIRRCISFHQFMENTWNAIAKNPNIDTPGHAAYAYKQAEMYRRLAGDGVEIQKRMKVKETVYVAWWVCQVI